MKKSILIVFWILIPVFLISSIYTTSPDKKKLINKEIPVIEFEKNSISICSFNIQFLGQSNTRDNNVLATILKDFDIVVVQELIVPPFTGKFPDGSNFKPDEQAAEFFNKMINDGFEFKLSPEDTGPGTENHNNSSTTEWWVVFFRPDKVIIANDLPTEFLENDRTNNEYYDRVPYAFAFRTINEGLDFVLISVHLRPGSKSADKSRRKEELNTITDWINDHDGIEKDFIILGDMNIEDFDELRDATPGGFKSLNDECRSTNTNVNSPKPYDHVIFRSRYTNEIDSKFDFRVFNLIEAMRSYWNSDEPYPGGSVNPIGSPEYDHDRFRKYYSDHHPVVFKMNIPDEDDD